jgi:hypothetical protein
LGGCRQATPPRPSRPFSHLVAQLAFRGRRARVGVPVRSFLA